MDKFITILSTKIIRPVLKKQLLDNNIIVEEHDFIKTVPVLNDNIKTTIKKHLPHYIFTSKKAAELFADVLEKNRITISSKHKVYCLQGETQKAVMKAGMQPTLTAASSRQLAQMIYKKSICKKLIFFCSDIRRNDLPAYLASKNIKLKEIVLYKTLLVPKHIIQNYTAVLFFSPSAVQSFCISNKPDPDTAFFCIGKTTAAALNEVVPAKTIIIADKPTQENITEKLITYSSVKNYIN